jgi:hypothetical protein
MVAFYENDQLNMEKNSDNKHFQEETIPAKNIELSAKVINIKDYSDTVNRTDSFSTWPHLVLYLEIVSGKIPNHNKVKKFKYHLNLHHNRDVNDGQILTFVFTEDGRLWGVKELTER